jgi:hypothetical protein
MWPGEGTWRLFLEVESSGSHQPPAPREIGRVGDPTWRGLSRIPQNLPQSQVGTVKGANPIKVLCLTLVVLVTAATPKLPPSCSSAESQASKPTWQLDLPVICFPERTLPSSLLPSTDTLARVETDWSKLPNEEKTPWTPKLPALGHSALPGVRPGKFLLKFPLRLCYF